jgi:hypothetical protein
LEQSDEFRNVLTDVAALEENQAGAAADVVRGLAEASSHAQKLSKVHTNFLPLARRWFDLMRPIRELEAEYRAQIETMQAKRKYLKRAQRGARLDSWFTRFRNWFKKREQQSGD